MADTTPSVIYLGYGGIGGQIQFPWLRDLPMFFDHRRRAGAGRYQMQPRPPLSSVSSSSYHPFVMHVSSFPKDATCLYEY
jgi:hypothetical protein